MTRDELLVEIVKSHNEMKLLIIKLIYDEKKYNQLLVEIDKYTDQELRELFVWIKGIEEKEYHYLKYVWELHTVEMWERFQLFNITGLREQGMLNTAIKDIRYLLDHPYRTEAEKERMAKKKSAKKHKL